MVSGANRKQADGVVLFFLVCLLALLSLTFFSAPASAEAASAALWTISDSADGGDCAAIGSWDAGSKSCHLATGLVTPPGWSGPAIEIASDQVTLNGNGWSLTGSGPELTAAAGVRVNGRSGVVVRGLVLENFLVGVEVSDSDGVAVADNTISGNGEGMLFFNSTDVSVERNVVSGSSLDAIAIEGGAGFTLSWNRCMGNDAGIRLTGAAGAYLDHNNTSSNGYGIMLDGVSSVSLYANTASLNSESGVHLAGADQVMVSTTEILGHIVVGDTRHGINLDNSSNVQMSNNTIRGCFIGIYLRADTRTGSDNLFVADNTISGNDIGIEVFQASHTLVVRNDFDNNEMQDNIGGCMEHLYFSTDQPLDGNRWSDYDEPAEGCVDGDGDGYCDDWFTVFGEYKDKHPMVSGAGACAGCEPPEPPPGPKPELEPGGNIAYWASYEDFTDRVLSVDFIINNLGPDAHDVEFMGVRGTNGATMISTPLLLGDIPAGGKQFVTLQYRIAPGTARFTTSLFLRAQDTGDTTYHYPNRFPEA